MPSLGREQAAPPQTEVGFRAGDFLSTVPGQSSSRRSLIKGSLAGVDEDQKQQLRSTLQNKKQDYIRQEKAHFLDPKKHRNHLGSPLTPHPALPPPHPVFLWPGP